MLAWKAARCFQTFALKHKLIWNGSTQADMENTGMDEKHFEK